jgi:hypothetical protein
VEKGDARTAISAHCLSPIYFVMTVIIYSKKHENGGV